MTLCHTSLLPVNTAVMELVGGPPLSIMGGPIAPKGYKLRHLGVTERLLIGAVVNWPLRPWGAITDLAGLFHTSRPTIYAIGERAWEIMLPRPGGRPTKTSVVLALPAPALDAPTVAVTDARIKRTLLTCLFPGGVTIRPMQDCLEAAFDQTRSVGFLSEFINEAGRRAGEILDNTDFSPLGEVIVARDETYFDGLTFLVTVEPRCLVIISGHAEEGCDAETWGVSLAIDHQTRGLRIIGLAEDAARYYPCSLREAELSVPVQKDVWHPMNKAARTVTDLERIALRKLEQAEKLEQPLHHEPWNETAFNAWVEAIAEAEKLVEMSGELREQELNDELEKAKRHSRLVSVLVIDIDRLKLFNDTYGHPAGYKVIRTVAQAILTSCRKTDIVGRYGGDEFAVILPETDAQGTAIGAERILAALEKEPFQAPDGSKVPISVSIGAASYPSDSDEADQLLSLADAAMYRVKELGEGNLSRY